MYDLSVLLVVYINNVYVYKVVKVFGGNQNAHIVLTGKCIRRCHDPRSPPELISHAFHKKSTVGIFYFLQYVTALSLWL